MSPARADDYAFCVGCGAKMLPEGLDKQSRCYGDCSPFDDSEDEEKNEKDE